MHKILANLLLLCLFLALAPATVRAQGGSGPIDASGDYVNKASGMTFPLAVGRFTRASLFHFDREERDVSASYNLVTGSSGIVTSVYVYPMPQPPADDTSGAAHAAACKAEVDRRKQEVFSYRAGAALMSEKDIALAQGGKTYPGRLAVFEFEASFRGQVQPLHSELYVFCDVAGSWAFEYRFTTPKGFDYAGSIAGFMRDLVWTVHPAK
ncbi:MAG TPA: hypothetical protein VK433_07035 [Stellaceae bacterium]|nr:hypothetical protein [Stellaceae bacterium]